VPSVIWLDIELGREMVINILGKFGYDLLKSIKVREDKVEMFKFD